MSGRNPFDMGDVRRLRAHLAQGVPRAQRDVRAVVARGALNIKTEWRQNARASAPKHAPSYPRSISFDVHTFGPDQILAIIGPDKSGPQGALGNLLEYGSAKNPPHNDGGRALVNETPRFEAQMALVLERGLTWW
ncbi:hypothetical protein [Streptomyces sp. NPDC048445]|uniref:hypothetical protein n=1 Tax=Streptomyces sp. NPDC048445 TaxID=3365553 RepID=UPI003719C86F